MGRKRQRRGYYYDSSTQSYKQRTHKQHQQGQQNRKKNKHYAAWEDIRQIAHEVFSGSPFFHGGNSGG